MRPIGGLRNWNSCCLSTVRYQLFFFEGENHEVGVHPDFDVMMGAYRNDFRANARRVLSALAENPEMDFVHVAQLLNISENSVQ